MALMLTLVVLGKLAGMTTLVGRAQWVRFRAGWLSMVLPPARQSFACAATSSNMLRAVDAQQVSQVMNDLLTRVGASAVETTRACTGYFLRDVAYFSRFDVFYVTYHSLRCLTEASCLGQPLENGNYCAQ